MRVTAIALIAALAAPAFADPQAIPPGATPSADQLGHVFLSICKPTNPVTAEEHFALAETAFGWVAADLDTDLAFQTPDGAITATFDGNPLKVTCAMTIPSEIGGDGADLYEGLAAHLAEVTDAVASAIDGGLVWEWSANATHTLQFVEGPDGFSLTLESR